MVRPPTEHSERANGTSAYQGQYVGIKASSASDTQLLNSTTRSMVSASQQPRSNNEPAIIATNIVQWWGTTSQANTGGNATGSLLRAACSELVRAACRKTCWLVGSKRA